MRQPLPGTSGAGSGGGGSGGRGAEHATLAGVTLVVTLLCGLPLFLLFRIGLSDAGGWTLAPLGDALGSASVQRALVRSLESGLASALLASVLGTAVALAVGLTALRARAALVFFLMLPMMIPPHVTAIAWVQAFGGNGVVLHWLGIAPAPGTPNPVQTPAGLIVLLAVQHLPLVFLVVQSALRQMPPELGEAARLAGASPALLVRRIVLPRLVPAIAAAFTLAFIAALGNFGINAIIGVPARYTTLPVLLWQRLSSFGPAVLDDVATIAVILALLALAIVALSNALARRADGGRGGTPSGRRFSFERGRRTPLVELLLWTLVALTLVVPLVSLVATSLVPTYGVTPSLETLTFRHYVEVLVNQSVTLRAFGNSTLIAALAACAIAALAIVLGHFLTRPGSRRGLHPLAARLSASQSDLAYAVPGLVMSIAFILAFIRPLPLLGVSLYGSLALILLAYLAVFLAVGLKPVTAAYAQLDPSLDEAARVCGARFGTRLRRVHAPGVMPAAVSGAILVFLTAYNEITVSALLWSSGNETIGTVIFNYEDGGYTTLAAAMATVTVVATVLIMLAMTRLRSRVPPGTIPWARDG